MHHVDRLVQAGHKVGLGRSIERVTLKHASDKASGSFARQLCEIYTRVFRCGGWAGRLAGGMAVFPERIDAVSSASNIAACFETTSMATKPAFGFSDVDKAIGDVVIDTFFDDMTR